MTVVRASSLHERIQSGVAALQRDIVVPPGLFRGRDAGGCPRRGILSAREPTPHDPECERWMSLIADLDLFDVLQTRVALSDLESRLFAYVDMAVSTGGENLLIMLRPHSLDIEAPTNGDVLDMTAAMYLAGIHAGLVIYYSGKKILSFFVNPDKKTYKELLELIISGSRHLYKSELRGELPEGTAGASCKSCPHKGNCDSAVTAHGGKRGSRKDAEGTGASGDRPEEGEQTGTSLSEES